jgi:hypothetical protein
MMPHRDIPFTRLLVLAFLINIIAQAVHESGHLLAYQAFGRNPTWGFIGLVQLWGVNPLDPSGWVETRVPGGETGWLRLDSLPTEKSEIAISAAAGPTASLLFALAGLWMARKHGNDNSPLRYSGLMAVMLTSFAMTMYYLRSPLRTIGDEYDIAVYFGFGKLAVEIPFALTFLLCLVFSLRVLYAWHIRFKWLAAVLAGSVPSGILLMIADGYIREAVNQGYPLFQALLGYSLPVLVVYLLAILGTFAWQSHLTPQPD